jgi:hypothetical protein
MTPVRATHISTSNWDFFPERLFMASTLAQILAPVLAIVSLAVPAVADDPPAQDSTVQPASASAKANETGKDKVQAQSEVSVSRAKKAAGETQGSTNEPPSTGPTVADPNDSSVLRAQTKERLSALPPAGDKAETDQLKALREILQERMGWLDEWDKEDKALNEAEHPEKSPENQSGQLKSEYERLRTMLEQSTQNPQSLLPETFRKTPEKITSDMLAEMKETIDAAKNEFTLATSDLEKFRSGPAQQASGTIAALRAERDKIHQRYTTLPALRAQREAAVTEAESAENREVAQERLINIDWEIRVSEKKLKTREAQIALETKLSTLIDPQIQFKEARRALAKLTLETLQARYRAVVDQQQAALRLAAAHEEVRADQTEDPLERIRARQNAELLALKARALNDEQAPQGSAALSLVLQTELADRAQHDFESLKRLVKEGRAGALVSLRLKNDYRRLQFERAMVARTDLAEISGELTRVENALTIVELNLFNGARDERFALDGLIESLPASLRSQAISMAKEHEAKRRMMLLERRAALEKLSDDTQAIHKQVLRRMQTLEDQYAYVRTHIFWMRDEEPINRATLTPVPREFRRAARAALRIVGEASSRSNWSYVTAEFVMLFVTIVALPWPLLKLRLALRRWLVSEPQA